MLVLLPPSETKAEGGSGGPLDLDLLSHPELNPVRAKLVDALVDLAADVPASLAALGLSERQAGEVARNAELRRSPTTPALARYTGVLYDALGLDSLTKAERSRAHRRLAVASALFGLVGGGDPIPAYRLSGGSALPATGPLGALWRPVLEPVLAGADDFMVDLRSSPYNSLARVPGAAVVRVVTEDAKGRRNAVSHFNKAHKGRLARALVESRSEPADLKSLVRVATRSGFHLEPTGPHTADLVV
ncbi:peroxide stress protein YaaA [Saccharothrix syringae]|uniref:Peroxide stress protein YaaA n=1 Tax=Saccharothrix syringae TaxID=103733 RepID=A0A5Q0H9R1_SACSY|nr:peroxide stress protein YaaA [Saccharothrix syringae]QFZ22665.1 peroxide stress protein YaaA [Saccharothrix syringae]